MLRSPIAVNKFKEGFNCAQSVVFSFSDLQGSYADTVFKAANGFGGGMGRKQEICGAITGGIMVLSLLYGRSRNDDKQPQETTYIKVRELIDRFTDKFDSINCRCLLDNCDLLTPGGQERFRSERKNEKCCEYVGYAVRLVEEIAGC